ncbi:MAG TPA: sulfurtransferase TusA family protein [Desulfosalsimonadaceae bacterium]|nr:sulfurtransferase TusA family protein [Desulfosalsimonadaceae bacterium]
MATTVDARGLSCPQPVLMTLDEIKQTSDTELVVLVDTEASKENVSRAVESQGWKVREIREDGDNYQLDIQKG